MFGGYQAGILFEVMLSISGLWAGGGQVALYSIGTRQERREKRLEEEAGVDA